MNRLSHWTSRLRGAVRGGVTLLLCAALLGCEGEVSGDGGALNVVLDGGARDGQVGADVGQAKDDRSAPISGGLGALVLADGEALELRRVEVDATASAGMASITVTHTFHNPLAQQLEGTFRFTVPAGAIVTGLRMETDGKWVAGEIVGRRKAERVYRKIVDSMRDPALLRWQGGGRLELRIFPIPARADKRLALDLLVPTTKYAGRSNGDGNGDGGARLRYSLGGEPGDVTDTVPLDEVVLRVDGEVVFSGREVDRQRVVTLRFPDRQQPTGVWLEQPDGPDGRRFLATALALPEPPAAPVTGRRSVVVLVDRSRSALGATALQARVVRSVLSAGAADDHFILAATDITCRPQPTGFQSTDQASIDNSLAWLHGVDADGASDVGEALRCAARLLADAPAGQAQVVLIHDGVATWGALQDKALLTLAAAVPAPIFCAAVGRATSVETLTALAQVRGGEVFTPRRAGEADRVGRAIAAAPSQGRWRDVRVVVPGLARALPDRLGTVFAGRHPWILIEVPPGAPLPTTLEVRSADRAEPWRVPLIDPRPGLGLRQRFGTRAVAAMQRIGLPKEPIIAASRAYGVLSKHTALLVLESEEAYARHGIQRANQAANLGDPHVSGADLESLSGGPTVSPDRIQPGDPEVRVPAPRDARSVTVDLPWGERLAARWEPDSDHGRAAWVARFLVDLAVPEGRYPLDIHIVFADGTSTDRQLTLTVDTTAPSVRVSVARHPRRRGVYIVRARQLAPHAALDARGVEVRLPDGQVIALKALRLGVFVGRWRPNQTVVWPLHIEVLAIDRALNQRSAVLVIRRPGGAAAMGRGRRDVLPRASQVGDLSGVRLPTVGRDVTAMVRWRGHLVVGTLTDGLWRVDGPATRGARRAPLSWRRLVIDTAGGAPLDRRINRLAVGADGTLWVATARGLGRIDASGRLRRYDVADGLPASDVHSLWVPRQASDPRWAVVGTGRGAVVVMRDGALIPLGSKQGLPVRAVWDIAQTPDGALWLGSSWGVYRWKKGTIQRYSVATGHLKDDWVTALATYGDRVFVGTYRGGVTELRRDGMGDDVSRVATWRGGVHINLGGLRVRGDSLWAATMEGALRVDLDRPAARLAPTVVGHVTAAAGNVTAVGAAPIAVLGTRSGLRAAATAR